MIIPLDKLLGYDENKYILTRANMVAVDKIDNIENYPEEDINWKIVPNILKLVLEGDIKFDCNIQVSDSGVRLKTDNIDESAAIVEE